MPNTPRRVFLSYSTRDRARVVEIAQALEGRGLLAWRDRNEILGGENYGPRIVEAVKQSVAVLLCCSRSSVGSKNVKQEVQRAWKYNVPCLPLLLDGVRPAGVAQSLSCPPSPNSVIPAQCRGEAWSAMAQPSSAPAIISSWTCLRAWARPPASISS